MSSITVTIKGVDPKKWLDDISQSQIPFAASKALNEVAKNAGWTLARHAGGAWRIRTAWSKRYQMGRRGDENDPPRNAAFFSTFTDKHTPIKRMRVVVGTPSWQVAQQTETSKNTRNVEQINTDSNGKKISYIAIPIGTVTNGSGARLNWGRNGHVYPSAQKLLNNPAKYRAFTIRSGENLYLCQRTEPGKAGYGLLYKLVKAQDINPSFDFKKIVEDVVNREFDKEFERAMAYALATYKPKEFR